MARSKKPTSKPPAPKPPAPKPPVPKQPAPKQPPSKQPAPKQPAPKQPAPKLPAPKLSAPKPPAPRKPAPKQPAPRKPAPKHPAPKQPAPKPPAPKQPAPKPPASKQPASKQPASKQPAPKQPAPKQPANILFKPIGTSRDEARTFDPLKYVTRGELLQIDNQFAVTLKGVDSLLFWTGVERSHVQRWADQWGLKTLTTAMGPLMDSANPYSPKTLKSKTAFSRYMKGASGQFAQYARQNCRAIVLTNPPPDIYSTREDNTYQSLEEPILKGVFGGSPVSRIDYVHPTVEGAAHVLYQVWPCDKTKDWVLSYGKKNIRTWKKLIWSHKSIITTSQLNLELQPTKPTSFSVKPTVRVSESVIEQGDTFMNNFLFRSHNLSGMVAVSHDSPGILANHECDVQPQHVDDLVKKEQPYPTINIKGHESRVFAQESEQADPVISDSRLSDAQVNDRFDQRIDFHEMELFLGFELPPAPVYAVERCLKPEQPVKLPVVHIDSLEAGAEITIDIDKNDVNGNFMFLEVTTESGVEHWWKMSWM